VKVRGKNCQGSRVVFPLALVAIANKEIGEGKGKGFVLEEHEEQEKEEEQEEEEEEEEEAKGERLSHRAFPVLLFFVSFILR
jgi:hypothetical protein